MEGDKPDRIPLFEVWIDALYKELEISNPLLAHQELGQDVVLLPSSSPAESKSWKDGVDEFGRIWSRGFYKDGAIKNTSDLKRFSPPTAYAEKFFSEKTTGLVKESCPDHFPFFGTHIGPFMSTYMAMGMENMFCSLHEDLAFVKAVMETRTKWSLAIFKEAVRLGAELIVMGDDAAHRGGPMISPSIWEELILPHHRQIVDELPVPVIWHSDGRIDKLLPFAVQAGFAGIHGMEPPAGNNLANIKQLHGQELMLVGNVDV
ncbi:MAG: uroporphyrinogen decarboxylase family protein, partial [Bacillota bacterium]